MIPMCGPLCSRTRPKAPCAGLEQITRRVFKENETWTVRILLREVCIDRMLERSAFRRIGVIDRPHFAVFGIEVDLTAFNNVGSSLLVRKDEPSWVSRRIVGIDQGAHNLRGLYALALVDSLRRGLAFASSFEETFPWLTLQLPTHRHRNLTDNGSWIPVSR